MRTTTMEDEEKLDVSRLDPMLINDFFIRQRRTTFVH